MRILSLDLGTHTGWATAGESGVQDFALRRGESPGMRYLRFRLWLEQMIADTRPEVIVWEDAYQIGRQAVEVYHGFSTRVQEVAAQAGIECCPCHSSLLKSHATGRGNADKAAVKAAAAQAFADYDPAQDPGGDEADARWLLKWAQDGFPQPARKERRRKARDERGRRG